MEFKWQIYKILNPDISRNIAFNSNGFIRHYTSIGMKLRRKYSIYQVEPNFNHQYYKNRYDDIKHLNDTELEIHWLLHGKKENRVNHETGVDSNTIVFPIEPSTCIPSSVSTNTESIKNVDIPQGFSVDTNLPETSIVMTESIKNVDIPQGFSVDTNLPETSIVMTESIKNVDIPQGFSFDTNLPEISIVMSYFNNRKIQTINTLNSFENNYAGKYKFEVIIVDDNSEEENRLDNIVNQYSFPIKYRYITREEKGNRINPCGAYNTGFKMAKGYIVIIQNPECYHFGDIIDHAIKNITDKNYLSYSCFNTGSFELSSELLSDTLKIHDNNFLRKNKNTVTLDWYNHPTIRPVNYHFCSVITKRNLDILGGFDEAYADGYCFDDDDFLLEIQYKLKLNVITVAPNEGFVVHQYHNSVYLNNKSLEIKWNKNKELFDIKKLKYTNIDNINYIKFNEYFKNIKTIKYFTYCTTFYYFDKMLKYVKIIKHYYPELKDTPLNINKLLFNNYSFDSFTEEFNELTVWFNNSTQEDFFILDEITYCHFLGYYLASNKNKKTLENFLSKSKYIVFFSELFESKEKMNTIGNSMCDINFTKMYFGKAYKCCLCDGNNISLLRALGIYTNIIYFPPTGYSEIINYVSLPSYNNKPIDILIYGAIDRGHIPYRSEIIDFLKNELLKKGYNIVVYDRSLYGEKKDEILKQTKIVIHIPMFESQYSFPWAKCSELMAKKIFFILSVKTPSINFTNNNDTVDIPLVDFLNKETLINNIEKYINDENYRKNVIENNYEYIKKYYNLDLMLLDTFQKK
jgi:hypothetical protein